MTACFKILLSGTSAAAAAVLLAGCPAHPNRPGGPPSQAIPAPVQHFSAPEHFPAHLGRPFDVVASESLLTIQVYRGGPLAKAGHNHVIASRELSGTIYVTSVPSQTTFEVRLPVTTLSVDEPALRAQAGSDFGAAVPDSAREGTRRNMLGEALLNAQVFPDIVLRSESLANADGGAGEVTAHVTAQVRGAPHSIVVRAHYQLDATQVRISGEMALRQTELGLTPFSAMLGALQVEDEMRVKFLIVAHPAPLSGGAGH